VKRAVFIFVAFLQYAYAVCQVDSLTYGITAVTQGPGLYLSVIDPAGGAVTKISLNAAAGVPEGYGRAIDPLHHVFYYAGKSELLAFDLTTGDLIRQVPLTIPGNSGFHGITYNYRDSTLYGIAADVAGMNIRLAKIDPFNGYVTLLSDSALAQTYSLLAGTALDPAHGLYFFITAKQPSSHLVAARLNSGKIIADIQLAIDSGDRIGPMEYNCRDSSLYALLGNYSHGRKLARINPYTGAVTVLSRFNVADTILNEFATIDPFSQTFYFESIDRTYRGVNIVSGDLVSLAGIVPPAGSFFTGFLFNNACYVHPSSSVGSMDRDAAITLFPNPVRSKLNIRSAVPVSRVEILDFTGRPVFAENCRGIKEFVADLSLLCEGIYLLRISTGSRCILREFVKISKGDYE